MLCRRQQQDEMIEKDVIKWLVQRLRNYEQMSEYMLEYAVALLMNLCLRTTGQRRHDTHNTTSPRHFYKPTCNNF